MMLKIKRFDWTQNGQASKVAEAVLSGARTEVPEHWIQLMEEEWRGKSEELADKLSKGPR